VSISPEQDFSFDPEQMSIKINQDLDPDEHAKIMNYLNTRDEMSVEISKLEEIRSGGEEETTTDIMLKTSFYVPRVEFDEWVKTARVDNSEYKEELERIREEYKQKKLEQTDLGNEDIARFESEFKADAQRKLRSFSENLYKSDPDQQRDLIEAKIRIPREYESLTVDLIEEFLLATLNRPKDMLSHNETEIFIKVFQGASLKISTQTNWDDHQRSAQYLDSDEPKDIFVIISESSYED